MSVVEQDRAPRSWAAGAIRRARHPPLLENSLPTLRHFPDFDTFFAARAGVHLVPVFRRLAGDMLTPVTAFHRIDAGRAAACSRAWSAAKRSAATAFWQPDPFLLFEATSGACRSPGPTIRAVAKPRSSRPTIRSRNCRQQVEAWRPATLADLPPFCSGAVGYAGYDTVRYVEHLPNAPPRRPAIARPGVRLLRSHARLRQRDEDDDRRRHGPAWNARHERKLSGRPADAVRRGLPARRRAGRAAGARPRPAAAGRYRHAGRAARRVTNRTSRQSDFEAAVERCLEYIRAGDIFQVVLSQRLQTTISAPPFEIYRTLRVVNPSPFMFYLRMPQVTLVGSSPEIMVRVMRGKVTVRPLAGTRPRGASEEEDRRLAEELLADPKERAEHVMLVDLGRNDVGRRGALRLGRSDRRDDRRALQPRDAHHVERHRPVGSRGATPSTPCGPACRPERSPAPRRSAPCRSSTSSSRIAAGLTPARSGYFDFNGNMDTCIALRTIVVQGDKAYVQAGAGIVADSVPASEYQETLNKARGLLKAIEITERRIRQDRPETDKKPKT